MQPVPISTINNGDTFQNRKGNKFTCLAKEELQKGQFHRVERTQYRLMVHDHQLDRDYEVRYMDTDQVFKLDKASRGKT